MEIPKMEQFWDEQLHGSHRHANNAVVQQPGGVGVGPGAHSPYERNLNFATVAVEDGEYGFPKKKTVRDPLSHRIIEKRRRDRMNNCLADLARLLPPSSLRKGRGRIEKTEIVELAIKHLRHLQCHPCPMGEKCEYSLVPDNSAPVQSNGSPPASCSSSSTSSGYHSSHEEQFRLGFQECLSEAMHFLVEHEGLYAGGDAMCMRLVKHLNSHCDTVLRDHWGNQGKIVPGFRRANETGGDFKKAVDSGCSSSSGYHPNGSSSGSDGNGGNDGDGNDPLTLPVQNQSQHLNVNFSGNPSSVLDYEAENSCPSTPLSVENSDVISVEEKTNGRSSAKPPIPSIIYSHSSSNNGGSPAAGSNGRLSDDGGSGNSSTSFAHRYKFKSNIKQRFTADCQTKPGVGFPPNCGKFAPHGGGVEIEMDAGSDPEDREEGISVIDEPMLPVRHMQSSGAEEESEKGPLNGRGSNNSGSISADRREKIAFSPNPNHSVDSTAVPAPCLAISSPAVSPVDGHRSREPTEMKPNPEELLSAVSAIHHLGYPPGTRTKLPPIIGANLLLPDGNGVPAFALHEKGLFYYPVTLDKSAITPYLNKLDSSSTALYPVTISVCFVMSPDKEQAVMKHETPHNLQIGTESHPDPDKPSDFSHTRSPVPMPLVSGPPISPCSAAGGKPGRRVHRDSNNFVMNRSFPQHNNPNRTSKHSNDNRAPASHVGGGGAGYNYQMLPTHSPSPSSGFEILRSNFNSSPGLHANPAGGAFHTSNYQERNVSISPASHLGEIMRGAETEIHLACLRSSNSGGGNSSGNSSSIGKGGRKRSISSSPSGGSLGYQSWNEKGSSNSHDFYNFHSNTHNLQAMARGHLVATTGALSPMGQQRQCQTYGSFHADSLREHEAGYGQDKKSRKTKCIDQ